MVRTPRSLKIISSDQVDSGVLLTSDIASAEFNVANKLVKLDDSADVPLAQIPDTLTGKDADTVDGEEAADIVTDVRVKAHFPDTLANVLSDHDKAAHDALNIDADTVDSKHYSDITDEMVVSLRENLRNMLSDDQVLNLSSQYSLSDNILHSHDANVFRSSPHGVWDLVKQIAITSLNPTPSTIRVSFEAMAYGTGTKTKIFKNGSPVGIERTMTTSYQEFVEDLSFSNNDNLQLYVYIFGSSCNMRNFRVKGDIDIQTIEEAINSSNLDSGGDGFAGTNS